MHVRPNILYIFTDQQTAAAMSCAGNPYVATPHLDRLAAEGTRFTRAYCTFPLCTPSRASMMTGLYPHQCGIDHNEQCMNPAARARDMGNLLSAAGYACGYGGKWHIPWASPMEAGHGYTYFNAFDDNRLAADTLDFIQANRDTPFFAIASFDNPHSICEHTGGVDPVWGPLPPAPPVEACPPLPPNHAVAPYEPPCVRSFRRNDFTPDDWRRYLWTYYRLVERVDGEIGRILDGLDTLGLAESTLVIFSSDHGDHLSAHTLVQKVSLYEESARVPFLVRWPGHVPAGQTDDRLVSNGLDLHPTVCDYAGVAPPAPTPGRSLRPAFESAGEIEWRDHVIATTNMSRNGPLGRMVRSDRYKYIAYEQGRFREQLFDLENDPGEMSNLAASAHHREMLAWHRDRLRAWCEETEDTFGYHYTHPRVPFLIPGDIYPPDAGGLPPGTPLSEPPG